MPALPHRAAREPVPRARGARRLVRQEQVLLPRRPRRAHHLARHAAAPAPAEHGGVPPRGARRANGVGVCRGRVPFCAIYCVG